MMKKLKSLLKSKTGKMCAVVSALAVTMVPAAFAAEGGAETAGAGMDTAAISGAFESGLQNVVTTSISLISTMLPIALSLFAVIFVCRKGMTWFKSMAK